MKKTSFLAGALLAPAVALTIPGCGGGNDLLPTPTATSSVPATSTPTSMNTATPTPTGTGAAQVSNLTFGNGQRAILTSKVNGTAISGTIQILAATATARLRAIPFSFTAGTYGYTGTVTTAGAFTINGSFGTFAFKMTGQLATATKAGSYTLTVNGQTETGVIPIPGQPFPTPVPTSTGGSYNLTGSLTFSNVSAGSDVVSTAITSFNDLSQGGQLINTKSNGATAQYLSLNGRTGRTSGDGVTRALTLSLSSITDPLNFKPFSVGQVLPLTELDLLVFTVQGTSVKSVAWRSTSGTATIKALGTNSATVEFNAHLEPNQFFAGGKGSFDMKGSLTATGLTVVNK